MLKWHLPFYQEIFTISHFLQDPILTFGYQGIEKQAPAGANPFVPRLRRLLASEAKMRRLVKFARSRPRSGRRCGCRCQRPQSRGLPKNTAQKDPWLLFPRCRN